MTKPQRLPYAGQPSLFELGTLKYPAADSLLSDYTHPVNRCTEPTVRHSQDQYRCTACGVIFDVDEPRPPCLPHNSNTKEGAPQ